MNQVLNADNKLSEADTNASVETDLDIGSKTGYRPGSETRSEPDFDLDNADKANLVSGVLATEANKSQISKKKERKSNKSDADKQANLFNEIFEYIYIAQC